MRRSFFAILIFVVCPSLAWADGACPKTCSDGLRLDEIQTVGTAVSYKQRPSDAMLTLIRYGGDNDADKLDYAMPPIADQLDGGMRALEFDVAYDPLGGKFRRPSGASMAGEVLDSAYIAAMRQPGFKVIHVLDVDFHSSCLALKDCLTQVAAWLDGHKDHIPLLIALRPNDTRTPMPGATRPVPFDEAAMDALDAEIRAVFPANMLITPDMVQGKAASLREAVLAHNWPKLGAVRGKVMFLLDGDADKIKLYQGARQGLEGRAMFVTADESSPLAAVLAIDDPRKQAARITAAVKAGYIVRTRADENAEEARAHDTARRDAAFASGAQVVLTSFPVADPKIGGYKVGLTDNPRYTDHSNNFVPLAALPGVQTATAH